MCDNIQYVEVENASRTTSHDVFSVRVHHVYLASEWVLRKNDEGNYFIFTRAIIATSLVQHREMLTRQQSWDLFVSVRMSVNREFNGTYTTQYWIEQRCTTLGWLWCTNRYCRDYVRICMSLEPDFQNEWGRIMMTSSNGNIFRVTGPLRGEFTGPGEFPTQRPVTQSFDVFFDLRLNKRLSKQPWGWWFETPSWSLWRQCNVVWGSSNVHLWNELLSTNVPGWSGLLTSAEWRR